MMPRMLASVADLDEARIVQELGVDLIDLKNPGAGALGALPVAEVARIVGALGHARPISATLGDLPMEPAVIVPAVAAMARTGIDYVKIGFFPGGNWTGLVQHLSSPAEAAAAMIAVLFGDCRPELHWIGILARAGFAGVMLDTADKTKGSLRTLCEPGFLRDFVAEARRLRLLCGLAGSLRIADIPSLAALEPDYLGFRGALCGGNRTGRIEPETVRRVLGWVNGRGSRE